MLWRLRKSSKYDVVQGPDQSWGTFLEVSSTEHRWYLYLCIVYKMRIQSNVLICCLNALTANGQTFIHPFTLPSLHRCFWPSLLIVSTTIPTHCANILICVYDYLATRQDELVYNTMLNDGRHFEFVKVRPLFVAIDSSEWHFSQPYYAKHKHGTA